MTRALLAAGALVLALGVVPGACADGSFSSNSALLDDIWTASVDTATSMLAPGPLTVDSTGRPCAIAEPEVILDGTDRDRCPYIGDEAVTGMTLLVSTPSAQTAMRNELVWFANAQLPSGAIPASPLDGGQLVLIDYPAYWVQCVYDYVLYTGDVSLATQVWPNLEKLLDGWYPSLAQANGLIADPGLADYANIERKGALVSYYNAGYALALEQGASIATWVGQQGEAATWRAREAALVSPFNAAFWDPSVGAYLDTQGGPVVHPEDGNAFAILAGLASRSQSLAALYHLAASDQRPYGNSIADDDVWDDPSNWGTDAEDIVYPFIGYFEVLARFRVGHANSAIDLIRREWGAMLVGSDPTMWEDIGPWDDEPTGPHPSFDHGWSSGAAPALTSYVLGVRPTSPGFATFVVEPQPGTIVKWASGVVPTPHGDLQVSWKLVRGKPSVTVHAPPGEVWANASARSRNR
jgi:hypothetical protein